MTNPSIENLNILDTDYAEILANSIDPDFDLQLICSGMSIEQLRKKHHFIAFTD